ncbi:MAG: lytic transglycosylase domain-containing protein [Synergistaceae bacterium]|jgi:soluble lytic murein transglycosylase-like protein|nr:lytic transglycosylase domain-containing protein [Synergistaceae bacterium]
MGPNLTGVSKVLDRIDQIVRMCSTQTFQTPAPVRRFSEVLDSEARRVRPEQASGASASGSKPSVSKYSGSKGVDELRRLVSQRAEDSAIDEELIRAVIEVESGWNADAISPKGASGLMQLMPGTAAMLGVDDVFDPAQNIDGGVKYLSMLTDKYQGDVELALAAYHAGPSRVDAAGGVPFKETERYVRNVMGLYHRYREREGN